MRPPWKPRLLHPAIRRRDRAKTPASRRCAGEVGRTPPNGVRVPHSSFSLIRKSNPSQVLPRARWGMRPDLLEVRTWRRRPSPSPLPAFLRQARGCRQRRSPAPFAQGRNRSKGRLLPNVLIAFGANGAQHNVMHPSRGPSDLYEQTRTLFLRCKESVDVLLSTVAEIRDLASEAQDRLARSQDASRCTGDRPTEQSF